MRTEMTPHFKSLLWHTIAQRLCRESTQSAVRRCMAVPLEVQLVASQETTAWSTHWEIRARLSSMRAIYDLSTSLEARMTGQLCRETQRVSKYTAASTPHKTVLHNVLRLRPTLQMVVSVSRTAMLSWQEASRRGSL